LESLLHPYLHYKQIDVEITLVTPHVGSLDNVTTER